jgi:hypothetical protein
LDKSNLNASNSLKGAAANYTFGGNQIYKNLVQSKSERAGGKLLPLAIFLHSKPANWLCIGIVQLPFTKATV